MKKLMLVAAVAAMAFGAEASYFLENAWIAVAKGDKAPDDSVIRSGYYQAFIIENAGADINAVASYVNEKTVDQIVDEAKIMYSGFSDSRYADDYGQYGFASNDALLIDPTFDNEYQLYFVAYYGTPGETPDEFCVVGICSDAIQGGSLYFDDCGEYGCETSGWQTYTGPGPAPVPEPTSGLLLLIGVAGLALKRKRA